MKDELVIHSNSPMSFCPARILEIWRPRLKAWLKSNRVWNSETKGNHDKKPMGRKRMRPMMLSYALPSSWMESHSIVLSIIGAHACPICEEGRKAQHKYAYMLLEFASDQ